MKVGVAIQLNHTREEELLEFQMSLREIGVEPINLSPHCKQMEPGESL